MRTRYMLPNVRCVVIRNPSTRPLTRRYVNWSVICAVISELDIYRAANMLIERHGADALIEAGRMIDRMLDHGDLQGRAVWLRIKRALEALQALPSGAKH
jgi:hypothetical protein